MMQIVHSKEALQALICDWKKEGLSVGYVPTMGALHDGHLSLVELALEKSNRVVASIYVNPTQFAPHEDFDSYPRDIKNDAQKLKKSGAHLLYVPRDEEIYADGHKNKISTGDSAQGLETDFRPHFFYGVVNVVSRLFDHVQPDLAVFGEKDFQQLMVIREMVTAYNMNIDIIGAKIARDTHGLALSSRNKYLSAEDLKVARQLNMIIREIPANKALATLLEAGFDKIDYVSQRWGRVLAAAWLGKTRLIDNISQ